MNKLINKIVFRQWADIFSTHSQDLWIKSEIQDSTEQVDWCAAEDLG